MKFNDIDEHSWGEIRPFVDTCLLPLTGLTGQEAPWQVTRKLEKLRDLMDHVETPFRGRVITYPSVQYLEEEETQAAMVNKLCRRLKDSGGYRFVITITANSKIAEMVFTESDMHITLDPDEEWTSQQLRDRIAERVGELWSKVESVFISEDET